MSDSSRKLLEGIKEELEMLISWPYTGYARAVFQRWHSAIEEILSE